MTEAPRRTNPSRRAPDDGSTLVELLISIVLIGTLGLAVLSASAAAANGAGVQRDLATTQARLATIGDLLMNVMDPARTAVDGGTVDDTYVSCVEEPDTAAIAATYQAEVDAAVELLGPGPEVEVIGVAFWNGTSFGPDCSYAAGHRLQEVELQATASSGYVGTLRVLRRPFIATAAGSAPAPGGGSATNPDGTFTIVPNPGLYGPAATTPTPTTPTTTTAPSTTTTTAAPAPGNPSTTTTTTAPPTTPTTAATTTTTPTTTTTTTTTTTVARPAGSTCVATVSGGWTGNVQLAVGVTNHGSATTTSWKLRIAVPNGAAAYNVWGAKYQNSPGAIQLSNESWNGSIGGGRSIGDIGVQMSSSANPSIGSTYPCEVTA